MDLDHNPSAGHRVVMHVGVEISETAGRESCYLALLKAISHPDLESPIDDGHVFPLRMPMGCDAVSVRHLQAHGVIPARGTGVALEHCELRSCGHECRCRTVWNGLGRECMFFRRSGLSANREDQAHAAEQSDQV